MRVVGCGDKRGIAKSVVLTAAENGSSVHLHLRQSLLELALLRHTHIGKLVDVDEKVVGESHLAVKLVAEVDVVEIVASQSLRQQSEGKRALAATLLSDEHGHSLVAMLAIHLQPMRHHRAEPYGTPSHRLHRHSGNAVEEVGNVVVSVPLGQCVEEIANGTELPHGIRLDILVDVLTW